MALLTAIFIAMGQLNHAIHFYIYTLTGAVFRNELIKLFSLSNYNLLRQKKSSSSSRRSTHEQTLNNLSIHQNNHLITRT
jgi:hypothetical protein